MKNIGLKRALRESKENFRMLIENTSAAIFIYRDKILLANSAMEKLTGFTREELASMNFYDLVHPDSRGLVKQHCEALSRGRGSPLRCEYKVLTKKGDEVWIDFMSGIINYGGKPSGLGTAFDVTDRKRSDAALRESEERLRLLVERVSDYEIFMLDPHGSIISWNVGAERSKGYRPGEIIGKPHSIFFTGEDVERGIPEKELSVAAAEGRFEDEGWRVRKDGTRFWANVVTTALRDEDGTLRGYSKVIRDITDRKKAEDMLREREERYRVVAETASDVFITIDEQSRIVFANPSLKKLFGYSPSEVLGREVTLLMPERLRNAHLKALKRYLSTGEKKMRWGALEVPGLHREGYEVPLEISYGEFREEGKHLFTGIIRDITERKQAEKEKEYKEMLERFNVELETRVSERTMSLMALTLADRVRNPVTVIRWTGNKILEKGDIPGEVKEGLATVVDEAGKLEIMVKDFQSLLKSKKSVFSYVDINDVVSGVLSIEEKAITAKGVRLTVSIAKRPLKINAQEDLLRMAVFHLLRNAVEATPEGGAIKVATCGDSARVVLLISDTGAGIPDEVAGKIFDPFFSTKTRRFGMGLPLVKQIVSEHMGDIAVKSQAGKGTTFRLSFPARWTERKREETSS